MYKETNGYKNSLSDFRALDSLQIEFRERMDITFSQVLSALLTSFFACAQASENSPTSNKAFWMQLESVGFLAHFESLLSTVSEDQGILEDFSVAVESLSFVRIQIVKE